jgi:hypothetical protein
LINKDKRNKTDIGREIFAERSGRALAGLISSLTANQEPIAVG